jgi:hypothetical protein
VNCVSFSAFCRVASGSGVLSRSVESSVLQWKIQVVDDYMMFGLAYYSTTVGAMTSRCVKPS